MNSPAHGKADETLRHLIRTLHEVIHSSGHAQVASHLPWQHLLGKKGDHAGVAPPDFPEEVADRCVQAYSLAFQLADHSEENAMAQGLRSLEDEGRMTERSGTWETVFARLTEAGCSPESIAGALGRVHIEPVLTAHPTEAKRQTVLEHQRRLYRSIVDLENSMWTQGERRDLQETLRSEIDRLWRTGEIYLEKPSLSDERRMILHYLGRIFPQVVRRVDGRLRTAWRASGFDPELLDAGALPQLTFGNWVGGDRDGHPLVSPDFTGETLLLFRQTALDRIDAELETLARKFSFSENRLPSPAALRTRVVEWSAELGEAGHVATERNEDEPWRQYVNLLRAALPTSGPARPGEFARAGELLDALHQLRAWLDAGGASRMARHDIEPIVGLIRSFGFHLATVDIRQNSAFHDRAISELLVAAGIPDGDSYASWSVEDRRALLDGELTSRRPLARLRDLPDGPAREMLTLYGGLEEHRSLYGHDGLGGLIVSMTRGAEDLLAVYLLARDGGLLSYEAAAEGTLPLPAVPLFETIDDLRHAPAILDDYLSHPMVRRSLEEQARARGFERPRQQVMVGYSDSGKDGGIVASMWTVHQAQAELLAVGRRHGVDVHFFHGRGGTIGRGAGPTHRFVGALPAGSVGPMLRVTEQGETIRQKYANPPTAGHQLELFAASSLQRILLDPGVLEVSHELSPAMDDLYRRSFEAYRVLVEHPSFVPFFERATPIDAIEHSRIGSRPSRRPGERKLDNLRAIPWVFAWNQARFALPGWFGLGSALLALRDDDPGVFEKLCRAKGLEERWAPVHYLISNAATAYATASVPVMEEYAALAGQVDGADDIFARIRSEYDATGEALEAMYGRPLEVARPLIYRAVHLRSEALRPLHRRQIELLRRWRGAGGEEAAALVPQLLRTINAISSGLGATG